MEKETIVKLSKQLGSLINKNLIQYYFSMKEDIIGTSTFVNTICLTTTNIESEYVYHIDGDSREYICFYTDKDFKELYAKDYKLPKIDSFKIFKLLIKSMIEFVSYFQTIDRNDIYDNTQYEWATFICKTLEDKFIYGDDIEFPIARVIHQSQDNVMVFYMADYNKVAIFVLNADDYNLNPEKNVLNYLFENMGGTTSAIEIKPSNFKIVNKTY